MVFSDEPYDDFTNPEIGWAHVGLSEYVLVSLSLALIIATFSQQSTTKLSPKHLLHLSTKASTGEWL